MKKNGKKRPLARRKYLRDRIGGDIYGAVTKSHMVALNLSLVHSRCQSCTVIEDILSKIEILPQLP